VFRHAHRQARLRHVLSERHGHAEAILFAQQVRQHLVEHHLERRVVERQVMTQQQQQPPASDPVEGHECSLQRCLPNVQAVAAQIEAA
jgi:hypothetical protein